MSNVASESVPPAAGSVELLADTRFAAGFRGRPWGPAIPDGIEDGKWWGFFTGEYREYVDEFGDRVEVLTEHRLPVNHVVDENTPSCLRISQYNNYKLAPDDPQRNKRLIRRMMCDRQGAVRMYFNTKNSIRNAAISYSSQFAKDTWPHFLIIQELQNPLPLGEADSIVVTFNLKVLSANQLSTWPSGLPNARPSEITVPVYILVRETKRPDHIIWVGAMLYSNLPAHKDAIVAREQNGVAFYRRLPDGWTEYPALGEKRGVRIDVKDLLREAIARYGEIGSDLATHTDDYHLVHVNFGWEIIGHWESELILSDVSVRASGRSTAP